VVQLQTPSDPLLLEMRSPHVMELPPPLHPTGDHQIPDVKILEALPLLLSGGLNVGQGGVRLEDVSPLVGILLMVKGKRLILVFQRTTREASRTRRLDTPTRARGWSTRGDLLAMRRRDSGGLAIDHAEDVIEIRSIAEGHAYSMVWVVALVGVVEWGMMRTCQPMSSPYMFPTSAQQYSIIPTAPISYHRPPLYQQHPYAPMSIQQLSSIPGDCFRSIKPSTLSSVQAQPISI